MRRDQHNAWVEDPAAPVVLHAPLPLTDAERRQVRGRRALFLVCATGHPAQEVLTPAALLDAAGCAVTFAALDGGDVRLDPLATLLALAESPWDPTWRLMREAARDGRLRGLPSLTSLDASGALDGWLDPFDAVLVPGGHGRAYRDFLHAPLTRRIVGWFDRRARVLGLICHGTLVAALPDEHGHVIARGRTMACWPRVADRANRRLPWLGAYLVPYERPVAEDLEAAGADVQDAMRGTRRVQAVSHGRLVTARGPWSAPAFTSALLKRLAQQERPA